MVPHGITWNAVIADLRSARAALRAAHVVTPVGTEGAPNSERRPPAGIARERETRVDGALLASMPTHERFLDVTLHYTCTL